MNDYRNPQTNPNVVKVALLGTALVTATVLVFSSFYVVDEGTRGVLTRNGAFVKVADPGLGFKAPFIDSVTEIEIRNQALQAPVAIYSLDTQQYTAQVTVNYDIDAGEVERLFKQEGTSYATRRLWPLVVTELKEVAGKFSATRTIQERDVFGGEVREAVISAAAVYGMRVTEVRIENIDFTQQFENAIEAAMLAKAEVEREKNVLEQRKISAETKVVDAKAQAEADRQRAQGEADAKKIQADAEATRIAAIGKADADAIRQKADALAQNAALADYTYALAAQNWDGKLPTSFVPGSAIPFVNATR